MIKHYSFFLVEESLNSILHKGILMFYEIIRANQTISFKEEIFAGKDAHDVHVTIMDATPVQ